MEWLWESKLGLTGATVLVETYSVQEDSMMQVWLEEGGSHQTMAHC